MTGDEIIHVFEHSRLVSDNFTSEALTAAYVEALAALRAQQENLSKVSQGLTEPETPLTNADRIRAMSDDDLADFLAYTWATSARAWQKDPSETLYWLQQSAEEAQT